MNSCPIGKPAKNTRGCSPTFAIPKLGARALLPSKRAVTCGESAAISSTNSLILADLSEPSKVATSSIGLSRRSNKVLSCVEVFWSNMANVSKGVNLFVDVILRKIVT